MDGHKPLTPGEGKTPNEYYVSTSGNDSDIGSSIYPFQTIGHAVTKLIPGDTLYIRAGVYQEAVRVMASGTADNPINITSYQNETAAIDGNNHELETSGNAGYLVYVTGSYVNIKNIETRYSKGSGILLKGSNNVVDNCYVHHCMGGGILLTGDYCKALNCISYYNSMMNEFGNNTKWASGLSAARYPTGCTIKGCTVYGNWGEGISTFETENPTVEDNISYDNHINIYISDTKGALVQRNFCYESDLCLIDYMNTVGIGLWDEKGFPVPLGADGVRESSSYNIVINNYAHNFVASATKLKSCLIANNTFGGFFIWNEAGTDNTRIYNNISGTGNYANVFGQNCAVSNNLWGNLPTISLQGAGDVIGDPLFVGEISPYNPLYYKLLANSPALGAGMTVAEVTQDYWKTDRTNLDIGFYTEPA